LVTISRRLLNNYPWDAVVETLRHEMAHMIVDEVFCIPDALAHGDSFVRACNVLDIDPHGAHSAAEKLAISLPEKEKMARKVHKLLALGGSSHEAEAESAISKAHELMTKYNISVRERPDSERVYIQRPVGAAYKKMPTYVCTLARLVSRYYYVNYIIRHGYRGTKYIEMFGEPHNLDIAEYVYHFLLEEGNRQWETFKKTDAYQNRFREEDEDDYMDWGSSYGSPRRVGRRRSRYSKVAFIDGLYTGFMSKLATTEKAVKIKVDPDNVLPISTLDKKLNEEYDKAYPSVSSHYGSGYGNTGGYSAGAQIGRSISINPGVRGSRAGGTRLIA